MSVLSNELIDRDAEKLILINAAAAVYVSGGSDSLTDAYEIARACIRNGSALSKLRQISEVSL